MNLKNKKVLITGATGGIGNSLLQKFNELGATILATGTNEEKLANIKKNYPKVEVESFKLQDHDKIEKFVENVEKKLQVINEAFELLDKLSYDQITTELNYLKKNLQKNCKNQNTTCLNIFPT